MLYCPKCDTEYMDDQSTCADDGTPLLDRKAYESELARQGRLPRNSLHFYEIGGSYDRFSAETIAEAIAQEGIEVFTQSARGPTVGMLTEPYPAGWSVVVPQPFAERAEAIARETREGIEASAQAASKAASEAEERGETPPTSQLKE